MQRSVQRSRAKRDLTLNNEAAPAFDNINPFLTGVFLLRLSPTALIYVVTVGRAKMGATVCCEVWVDAKRDFVLMMSLY
jgi:hypothetical protein